MSGTHRGTPPVPKQQHAADGKQGGITKQAERVLVSDLGYGFVSALESCSADSILSLMARDSTTRSFMIDRLDELLQSALVTELTSLSNQLKLAEAGRQETAHKREHEMQEALLRCEALERQNGLLEAAQKEKDLFASKLRSELERLDADLAKSKSLLEKTDQEMKAARHEATQLASWKKDAESKLSQTTELKAGADNQIHTLKEQLAQSQRELESKTKTYSDDLSQLRPTSISPHCCYYLITNAKGSTEASVVGPSDQIITRSRTVDAKAQSRGRTPANRTVARTRRGVSDQRRCQPVGAGDGQTETHSTDRTRTRVATQTADGRPGYESTGCKRLVFAFVFVFAKLTEDHKKEKAELQDKIKYLRESSVRKDVYEAVLKEKDALAKQVLDGLVAQERQIEQEGFLNIQRSPNGLVKSSGHEMNPNAQLSSRLATSEATNLQLALKIKGLEEDGRDQAKTLKLYEEEINRQARLIKELRSSQAERGSEDNEQRLAIEELLSERGQLEARITELLAFCETQQESNLKGEGLKNALYRQVEQLQDALKVKDRNLLEVTIEMENTRERMNQLLQEKASLKSAERPRVIEDSSKRGSDHARTSSQQKLNGDSRLFELEERLKFQESQTIAAKNEIMALHEAINSERQRLQIEQSHMESEKIRLQALVDDHRDQASASQRKLSGSLL